MSEVIQQNINPNEYQKTGYALSSWNYGSFHHCNPYYQRREYIKDESNNEKVRSNSANINRLEKRILKEDEKIVTDDYLQMMKDFKTIKNVNSNKNKINKLEKNKSSVNLKTKGSFQTRSQNDNNSVNMNTNMNNSQQSTNKINKNFKYQLSFEEWAAVKSKQQEIYKKVKIIQESEDQNFEFYNKKIDENYKIIKEQNFNEWVQRKQGEKIKHKQTKVKQEDIKDYEKQKRQSENFSRLEYWFKKQAESMDNDAKMKKMKEEKLKAEQLRKQIENETKKEKANEAFKIWMLRKEEEKKEKRMNPTQIIKRTNSFSRSKSKLIIGPYSNAKDLKNIQKKIYAYQQEHEQEQEKEQDQDQEFDTENQNAEEEEKETYSKENIEDSLQELSSIKKDSPVQEQDPDYY